MSKICVECQDEEADYKDLCLECYASLKYWGNYYGSEAI